MTTGITRRRIRTSPHLKGTLTFGKWSQFLNGSWQPWFNQTAAPNSPFNSIEVCLDEKHSGPPYRENGPFTKILATCGVFSLGGQSVSKSSIIPINISGNGNFIRRYVGTIGNPDFSGVGLTNAQLADVSTLLGPIVLPNLSSYHTVVDKKLRPRISQASLMQGLVELRDIPRTIRSSAQSLHWLWRDAGGLSRTPFMSSKKLSNEWVNTNFGWIPFISDLNDLFRVTINLQSYLSDLMDRNDRWDHRVSVIEESESDTVIAHGTDYKCEAPVNGSLWQQMMVSDGGGFIFRHQYSLNEVIRTWCTGDYKFYRPEFDKNLLRLHPKWYEARQLLTLYGINVNPSTIYRLIPWTWLIDWFVNVGSVIDSVQAAGTDDMVSKNLCLMQRKSKIYTLTQRVNFRDGAHTFVFRREVETKQRQTSATPFGFSLSSGLTGRQLSILAALGLTRWR